MRLSTLTLLVLIGSCLGQDTTDAPSAAGDDAAKPAAAGADGAVNADAKSVDSEECEEGWEYLEFLKSNVKEKIEMILQDTLFEPRTLLEQTVADTMTQTLEIRDAILTRTKTLRTPGGNITICPGQGVNQEQFLTAIRMDIMSVLLKLIEPNSANPEKLQEIGKELLAIRSKVNGEITRIIMLRESKGPSAQTRKKECDCGILDEISDGLTEISGGPAGKNAKEGEEKNATAGGDPVTMLTMLQMTVDGRIGVLYNEILGELDEEKRKKATDELKSLKEISSGMDTVISKMIESEGNAAPAKEEEGAAAAPRKLSRAAEREMIHLRNDVERQLQQCRKACPTACESCGADLINDLSLKLTEYKANIEASEEEDAKEAIRADLMLYLTTANTNMTELLTNKANAGNLTDCDAEQLEVLEKVKGPLWMMVNITIFGDGQQMTEMLDALEEALNEMRNEYCSSEAPQQRITETSDECDQEEIVNTRKWISDIDSIIANSIFKQSDDKGRVNAMLGFIELKSGLDDRVRALFTDNLKCREEVEQIKNVYMGMVTGCLAEMMNPKFRFEAIPRAERVQCIKQLRVTMEERRGELLLREVERRINQENLVEKSEGGEGAAGQKQTTEGGAEIVQNAENTTVRA